VNNEQAQASRIEKLEFHLAHQQRLCEQLNEVVVEHTQQLMRYERALFRLEEQVKTLREQRKETVDPGIEKPPHY
jgi:uncharacterized coiled-coil protein SlyX